MPAPIRFARPIATQPSKPIQGFFTSPHWFAKQKPNAPKPNRRRATVRLEVEELESRLTPSFSTLASFNPLPDGINPVGLIRDSNGNFFGTMSGGGVYGRGTVFELVNSGGSYTVSTLVSFDISNGYSPRAGLIEDASGNLFGTTSGGGLYGSGTVFELVNSGGSYTLNTLFSFSGTNGGQPYAGLVEDSSGDLFGTTYSGGTSNDGTVFELAKNGGTYTLNTLASFNGTNGANPRGSLTEDGSGNLFGTTYSGGTTGSGTVFELVNSGGSYTLKTLASFNHPRGDLIEDSSGNLFGITYDGGANGDGTVFELVNSGGSYTFSTLVSFNGTNGANPVAGLTLDGSGNLFGTTEVGGTSNQGTVFELVNSGGSYTLNTLVNFNGANGGLPQTALVRDASGDLFGATYSGGTAGSGTTFELVNGGGTYTLSTLVSFDYTSNGANPQASLIGDASGDLFGTTYSGGTSNLGTVFELAKNGGTYTLNTLASFNGTDGANPEGGLVEDSSGDLFGTTYSGGTSNKGTVFELVNSGGSYTLDTLVNFSGANGSYPAAGLIADASGNLFGTTAEGGVYGPYGSGTVFELANSGGTYTFATLVSFNGGSNGANPLAGLVKDSRGDLFGTTYYGGTGSGGTVFELVNNGGGSYTLSTIANFNGTNGSDPQAGLIIDASGNLFGTTHYGGNTYYAAGTVFEMVNSGGSYSLVTLATLGLANEPADPEAGLVEDTNGNLFGTTEGGGTNFNQGTVFELVNSAGSYTLNTLVNFNSDNGAFPMAGLALDTKGNLFGTTEGGGTTSGGTVFEISPAKTLAMAGGNNGNGQTANVGTTLPNPLVVTVTDTQGNPVSGVTVNWAVVSGGGKVSSATSVTGANGQASVSATLGTAAGSDTYTATVAGLSGSPVTFTETASADVSSEMLSLVNGNGQSATVASGLPAPLVVKIIDKYGNPFSGVTVNWAATSGGGTVSAPTSVTGANGQAAINATLGTAAGNDTFTATVAGLAGSPVTFTATANADTSSEALSFLSGNNQSGTVASALSAPLVVKITDKFGNPFSGITMNWAAASGGGSVSSPTSVTGANGQASINATLGTVAGSDRFTATVSGLAGSPITFTETATAGSAKYEIQFSGSGQTGMVRANLTNPLVVQILDQYGNAVSGVTVNWSVASGGGSITTGSVYTSTNGQASVNAVLGTTAGLDTFTATVAGLLGSPVTFTETANPDAPASITVSAGSPQSTPANTAFVTSLSATVTDQYGNPVPNVTVVFAAPNGPSGAFTGSASVQTNSSGVATAPTFTANIYAGTYTVTASTSGVTSPASFSLTNQSSLGSSANDIYVHNVYALLLQRVPDPGAVYWVNLLNGGTSASTVVRDIEGSSEYLQGQVKALYLHYLARPADPGGLQYWTGVLARGATIENVIDGLVGSPEYFTLHGSNNLQFVQALYNDILGRPGSSAEWQGWVNILNGGATRAQVAFDFLTSPEYRTNLIDTYYSQFLNRAADSGGLNYFLAQLGSGVSDQAVLAAIFGSVEGYRKWS